MLITYHARFNNAVKEVDIFLDLEKLENLKEWMMATRNKSSKARKEAKAAVIAALDSIIMESTLVVKTTPWLRDPGTAQKLEIMVVADLMEALYPKWYRDCDTDIIHEVLEAWCNDEPRVLAPDIKSHHEHNGSW